MKEDIFNLKNKNIILTGSCGLLGTHFANLLSNVGANLFLIDISSKDLQNQKKTLQQKYENIVEVFKADVSSESNIASVRNLIVKKNKPIDGLINNAAINPKVEDGIPFPSLETYPFEEWNKEIQVSLSGVFLTSKYFGEIISKNKNGGSIINISSDLSIIAPDQSLYEDKFGKRSFTKPISYSASKFGLIGMTKYLASYWAKKKVRCNAISPAGIKNKQDKEFIDKISNLIPMQRMAELNDLSGALIYLLSDSSNYLTGTNIVIDGGRTII